MVLYKNSDIEQISTLKWTLRYAPIRTWDVAVDGGANVGEWALVMADHFDLVHAFEPGGMFEANHPSIRLHRKALLDKDCRVSINRKKRSNRGWYVELDESGDVEATTIDGLRLKSCGLIKLDLEGAEGLALLGGRATLRKCSPVVIIETGKAGRLRPSLSSRETIKLLTDEGYSMIYQMGCDSVFAK